MDQEDSGQSKRTTSISSSFSVDEDIIKDFFAEFDDMYDLVVNAAEKLEKMPNPDPTEIDSLFRGVHSIKSNLRMVGLNDISTTVHHLENILENIRKGVIKYQPEHGDIIRLALDEIRIASDQSFKKQPVAAELQYIANAIEHMCSNDEKTRAEAIDVAIGLLDPFIKEKDLARIQNLGKGPVITPKSQTQVESTVVPTPTPAPVVIQQTTGAYPYIKQDLNFLKRIAEAIEERLQSKYDRIALISKIASRINELSSNKVDPIQLQAAVYISNWGLSILPLSITLNEIMLKDAEIEMLKSFPNTSKAFFCKLPFWQPAAEMAFQCHERIDGKGYPNKITGEQICDGAKILAITQAFIAIMYARPYQHRNTRTIIAAIIEINRATGSQFDEYWSEIFNKAVKELYQEGLFK